MKNPNFDIHQRQKKYDRIKQHLQTTNDTNSTLILDFDKHTQIKENIGLARRVKYFELLPKISKDLNKNFTEATKEDIENYILNLQNSKLSIWSQHTYRCVLKKFYKHLGKEDLVKWVKTSVKRKEKPKIKASEILTEQEAYDLIDNAGNPRNKCLLSVIYELGCRVSEAAIRIKDITPTENGFIIDLAGTKTDDSRRSPLVVISAPYITAWLNQHPTKKPEDPLFLSYSKTQGYQPLTYPAMKKVILEAAERAGITKRVHLHLLRHSRATHLLANGHMNEAQVKAYFGWSPDSDMLSNYAHLTIVDANNAVLQMHGITKKQGNKEKTCFYCQKNNKADAQYCQFCARPLDPKLAYELEEKRAMQEAFVKKVLEKLTEKNKELVMAALAEVGTT